MKLDKKPFVEQAINTRCHAFFNELWFKYQNAGGHEEYYPELSCNKKLPKLDMCPLNGGIQGTMCFMDMDGGMANLYLACNYYNEIGEDYFVFWDCRDADHENGITQWVIWLPNVDYPN